MPRSVKIDEYSAKRNDILDAVQRLVFTKGYERMSIQDILDALAISKGAFYHYFDSKADLLEAYIERGQEPVDTKIRAIADDPTLSALDKLRRYFTTLDQLRLAQQAFIADLMRVWFADENAIVREKTDAVILRRRAPLLSAMVQQGVQEGAFTTPFPDQAGQAILSITGGMSSIVLKLILAFDQDRAVVHYLDEIVAVCAAMAEAIERLLGTTERILDRPTAQDVKGWMGALSR